MPAVIIIISRAQRESTFGIIGCSSNPMLLSFISLSANDDWPYYWRNACSVISCKNALFRWFYLPSVSGAIVVTIRSCLELIQPKAVSDSINLETRIVIYDFLSFALSTLNLSFHIPNTLFRSFIPQNIYSIVYIAANVFLFDSYPTRHWSSYYLSDPSFRRFREPDEVFMVEIPIVFTSKSGARTHNATQARRIRYTFPFTSFPGRAQYRCVGFCPALWTVCYSRKSFHYRIIPDQRLS